MDEPRDRLPEDQSPDASDSASTPAPSAPVERRDFFRRSVELAALSLFGVGAVDPLLDRVIAHVAERHGADRLTTAIAQRLAESGVLTPRAHAARSIPDCPSDYGLAAPDQMCEPEEPVLCQLDIGCPAGFAVCVPGSLYDCPETQVPPFACRGNTMPPFAGCRFTDPNPFKCEWGEKFHCQVDPEHFDCDKAELGNIGFSCPPWVGNVAWFDCYPPEQLGTFNCWYPSTYDCANLGGATYLCPSTEEFVSACVGPWDCASTPNLYAEYCATEEHGCGTQAAYRCHKPGWFACLSQGPQFTCGAPAQAFSCDEIGIWDFECGSAFVCGTEGTGEFVCTSNHVFGCWVEGFQCAGSAFRCATGGNRCGIGATGGYTEDRPGDFVCGRGTVWGRFECATAPGTFVCQAADDFLCGRPISNFTCYGRFSGCSPEGEGRFECTPGKVAGFDCKPQEGESFECGAPDHNCATDGRQFSPYYG